MSVSMFRKQNKPTGQTIFKLKRQDPIDPELPGVRFGKICAVTLNNHGGGMILSNDNEAAIIGDHVLTGATSTKEILDWVTDHKCCTLYVFGHQGTEENAGGAVTYELPPASPQGAPEGTTTPKVKIFPDATFELQLSTVFKKNCAKCAINIAACGGTTEKHREAREIMADYTGCVVCGSTVTPVNFGDTHTVKPSPGDPRKPWPAECAHPQPGRHLPESVFGVGLPVR